MRRGLMTASRLALDPRALKGVGCVCLQLEIRVPNLYSLQTSHYLHPGVFHLRFAVEG